MVISKLTLACASYAIVDDGDKQCGAKVGTYQPFLQQFGAGVAPQVIGLFIPQKTLTPSPGLETRTNPPLHRTQGVGWRPGKGAAGT